MLRPRIDEPSLKLQRDYAGHVLTLRGSLPNAGAAAAPGAEVQELHLDVQNDGFVEAGQEMRVQERVPTAPVAAFVGTLPMPIQAEHNHDGSFTVILKVPAGIKPEPGQVRLQWPTRTIPAVPSVRLRTVPAVVSFQLVEQQGIPGQRVQIGRFQSKPVEVEFGDAKAPSWDWENEILYAVTPYNVQRSLVRVTTEDRRYHRSKGFFRPAPGIYETNWVKVPDIGDFQGVAVIEVHVAEGDLVKAEDPLLTLESDKATMDVPSPTAGTVRDLRVKVGDRVSEGTPILRLEPGAAKSTTAGAPPPAASLAASTPKPTTGAKGG